MLRNRRRSLVLGTGVWSIALCAALGCWGGPVIPDQSSFVPLNELADSGQAVVRLYAAYWPIVDGLVVHSWFVFKAAEETEFARWEVWYTADEPYGYVHRDLAAPEWDLGNLGPFVVAELRGPEADPVVEFIRAASPEYPCREVFAPARGPNCNTYVQWVLDSTGWEVNLPSTMVGADAPLNCPR